MSKQNQNLAQRYRDRSILTRRQERVKEQDRLSEKQIRYALRNGASQAVKAADNDE